MSATPTPYDRQANFVTEAQGNANVTVSQIASELDAEFDAINVSLDQTQSRLAEVQRDDGQLRNQVVSAAALGTDVISLLGSSNALFKGNWATGTAYIVGNSVVQSGLVYYCVLAHTSGTFATDLAAGRWIISIGYINDASVTTAKVADGAITTAKLAANAVATVDIADGAVTSAKIADGTIVTADIADGAITSAKIADGTIATGDLANGAVTSAKMSTGAPTWDASGNLTATSFVGPVTGNVTGNAATATKFASAPAFSAIPTSAQAVTGAVNTKVILGTEEFDTNNCFDSTTNYRFTPNVAGYYQISGGVALSSTAQSIAMIYKNGSLYRVGCNIVSSGASAVSALVYLNGSTDYVELWGLSGTSQNFSTACYFQGVLVKPA